MPITSSTISSALSSSFSSSTASSSKALPMGWPTVGTTSTPATIIESSSPAFNLISAILTTFELDEISSVEGGDAIRRYIINQGMVRGTSFVQRGVMFWVYPTGGKGPYEDLEVEDSESEGNGAILLHGLLVTIERGALVEGMVDAIMRDLPDGGIGHIHFPMQVQIDSGSVVPMPSVYQDDSEQGSQHTHSSDLSSGELGETSVADIGSGFLCE